MAGTSRGGPRRRLAGRLLFLGVFFFGLISTAALYVYLSRFLVAPVVKLNRPASR